MSCTAVRMRPRTAEGFSPRRISTTPCTVSIWSLRLTTPWRGDHPSVTVATSLRKTGVPSSVASRTALRSSTVVKRPSLRMTSCSAPRSSTPPEAFTLAFLMPCSSEARVRPCAARREGSGCTWISRWSPPMLTTSATPLTRRNAGRTTQSCRVRSFIGSPPAPTSV